MEGFLNDAIKGYSDRMKRLAIFGPLFQLKQKRNLSGQEQNTNWFGLGLLTLLFFFENMLHRRNKNGVEELANFLYMTNRNHRKIAEDEFYKIAEILIENFRDPGGKKQEETYYDWETGAENTFRFSVLKTSGYDKENHRQYYMLDEAGLELVFATKEYFTEFRISINQLLIRKQLEKGEFASALHEVNEMRIAVETIRDNIKRLSQEVSRNIISDDTYRKYANTVRETHERLEREDEEFRELYEFVNKTKLKISIELKTEKDEKAYTQIVQIVRELGEVHHTHQQLLLDALNLKNRALESAKQALYSAGLQSFNFDQEIVSRVISSPLPPLALDGLIRPFTGVHMEISWSLLSIMAKQRLHKVEQEWESRTYPEVDEEAIRIGAANQQENFTQIMKLILDLMGSSSTIRLSDIIEFVPDKLLHNRSFYDFWLVLHQRSPVMASKSQSDDPLLHVLDGALTLIEDDVIVVTETDGILNITDRYVISNMVLERKGA
jgi:hypothetical protein